MNEFHFIDIKESDRSRNDSLVLVGATFQLNTTFSLVPSLSAGVITIYFRIYVRFHLGPFRK